MQWRKEWYILNGKKYGRFKRNYRKKGKLISEYVYLGNEKRANKISNDFISKKPDIDRVYTYTGELFLKDIANRLQFSKIVNNRNYKDLKWNIGEFIEIIIIERALNPMSKWALAHKIHNRSILSIQSNIPGNAISESNIYNYMDYIHPFLHNIQNELVQQIYKIFPHDNNCLILDGTSLYTHKADSDPDYEDKYEEEDFNFFEENDEGSKENINYHPISRRYGYSRDKRPDLPQVNVMLGVNERHIPLFFEIFAGNTLDLKMFEKTLLKLHTSYKGLLERMKDKFIIFDRGNISLENTRMLEQFCGKWHLHFVGGVLSILVKEELAILNVDDLPIIFSQDKTHLYGKTIKKVIYERSFNVLLYISKSVRTHKLLKFQTRLEKVENILAEINEKSYLSDIEKVQEMKTLLRKYSMVQLFKLRKFESDDQSEQPPISLKGHYHLLEKRVKTKQESLIQRGLSVEQFQAKLKKTLILMAQIEANEDRTTFDKVQQMKILLKKKSLVKMFWLTPFNADGTVKSIKYPESLYQFLPAKANARKNLLGKFAIISNKENLTAEEMMKLYKTKEVVEHEFHILKSLLRIRPIFHRSPNRIETHNAIVHWSMLLLSTLRCLLEDNGSFFSFEELLHIIRIGGLRKKIFLYSDFKNFQLTESIDINPDLDQIFKILNLTPQPFHIEVIKS